MQIPLRFVFVYSFRLIDTFVFAQDYDEFRKNFLISVNANLKPKINAKCDESEKIFFNILIDSKSLFWTVEMTECGFG